MTEKELTSFLDGHLEFREMMARRSEDTVMESLYGTNLVKGSPQGAAVSTLLGLHSGEDRIWIHGQTLAVHEPEDLWRVREVKTFVGVPPARDGEIIRVEEIGAVHGHLLEKDGGFWIDLGK